MDDEMRGVKGWLLTFVIIIALVSPAWSAINVYRELYTGDAAYLPDTPMLSQVKSFGWALIAVRAALGLFAAWRLVMVQNWRSVQIAIVCIWLISLGGAIAEYVGISTITGASISDLMAENGPRAFLQAIGFGLIWTAYLLKSERVKNTYRGVQDDVEVFE